MANFSPEALSQRWQSAGPGQRLGFACGVLALVGSVAALLWWLLMPNYQVLFSDLDPQDAAAIVSELERMKLAHRLQDEGRSVLVEQNEVHRTRLKLMSKGVNLRGTVGFELFADNDFGMTEFAQKINYQRALQGELARTIMSLEEVRAARVHLVLPESGLLRKGDGRGKASITITTQPGRKLQAAQVAGIQRLVAAAVPQIEPFAVTLLDSRGVALNPALDGNEAQSLAGSEARLELKRQTEAYFAQKAGAVLEQAVGPGRAIVTVDVALNQDAMKMTQEQVLVAPLEKSDVSISGAVLKSRQSSQKESRGRPAATIGTNIAGAAVGDAAGSQGNESSNIEVEYQHGKRIEQLVSAPGAVRRISVAIVLPELLPAAQMEKLSEVVGMAVGLVPARGDGIALYSKGQLAQRSAASEPAARSANQQDDPPSGATASADTSAPVQEAVGAKDAARVKGAVFPREASLFLAAVAVLLAALLGAAFALRRARTGPARLSPQARQQTLRELNDWLAPHSRRGSGS